MWYNDDLQVARFDDNPEIFGPNGSVAIGSKVSTIHDYWTDIAYSIDKVDLECQVKAAPTYSKYGIKMPSPKDYFNLKGMWSYNGRVWMDETKCISEITNNYYTLLMVS